MPLSAENIIIGSWFILLFALLLVSRPDLVEFQYFSKMFRFFKRKTKSYWRAIEYFYVSHRYSFKNNINNLSLFKKHHLEQENKKQMHSDHSNDQAA